MSTHCNVGWKGVWRLLSGLLQGWPDPSFVTWNLPSHCSDFNAKPHACAFCGKRFKRKDHKVEHERIHTGERPFPCTLCNSAFVQKQQLVSHMRHRHWLGDLFGVIQYVPSPLTIACHSKSNSSLNRRDQSTRRQFVLCVFISNVNSVQMHYCLSIIGVIFVQNVFTHANK